MKWIPRAIEPYLKKTFQERPALVVTGPRQAGKTSLARHCFNQAQYVSLDLPIVAKEAEEAGEAFLKKHECPLILDEVQHAPKLFRYLKNAIDQKREQMGQYCITGSQQFGMMQGVSDSLAGRVAMVHLHTLSAQEFEKHSGTSLEGETLLSWIYTGGYPELISRGLDPIQFYSDYVATYLERDVRQIVNVKNLRDFHRFLQLCALRTGQLVSYSDLSADVGVSPNTIKSWVSALETSHVIYMLGPCHSNRAKRVVKTPKLYFLDTGLACSLAGIKDPIDLKRSSMLGALFETHVLGQILRSAWNRGRLLDVYFFRDHQGNEVDFILPKGRTFSLIECKWSEDPQTNSKGFGVFSRLVSEKNIASKTIVYSRRESFQAKDGVTVRNSVEFALT